MRLPHQIPEFFPDNFDDLLTGRQTFKNSMADSLFLDPSDKVLHNLEIDIGLEQRQTNFF